MPMARRSAGLTYSISPWRVACRMKSGLSSAISVSSRNWRSLATRSMTSTLVA